MGRASILLLSTGPGLSIQLAAMGGHDGTANSNEAYAYGDQQEHRIDR